MRALLLLFLVACSGGDDPADTDLDSDTDSDTAVDAFTDLGAFCPMGCNLQTCVDSDSEDCESALCLYDGRFRIDSYCTQPCDGSCPEGYTCATPEDGSPDVCFANPAVCGNGIVERGEACDDGNTEDGDFCAGSCSEVTVPPSGGTFSFGTPGGTPIEFEGVEPTVFAYRRDLGSGRLDLSLGTGRNDVFSLEIADIGNATVPGTVFTNVTTLFGVCNYAGAGMVTMLESYDADNKTAKGTYRVDIQCFANCFDCGGDNDRRTYEGSFDVEFRDVE